MSRSTLIRARAGERFGQDESDQRGGDHDEKKDRQNDGLANADNPPVIQEMQFRFRGRR